MRNIKKVIKSSRKVIGMAIISTYVTMSNISIAYAGSISTSKLVTGTTNLFKDATSALVLIAPGVGGTILAWNLFGMKNAEDDGDAKIYKKRIKTTIVATVGVTLASGIVTLILGYYK